MEDHDEFWERLPIPYQDEDPDYDFTNPIVISQDFVRASSLAAQIGEQAEVLTEQVANLEVRRDRAKRKRAVCVRKILSASYDSIAKSARSDVIEAFIYKRAEELDMLEELEELDDWIEHYQREIEVRQPRLSQYKNRLRLLENKMDWAREYLNYDKHMDRIHKHTNHR